MLVSPTVVDPRRPVAIKPQAAAPKPTPALGLDGFSREGTERSRLEEQRQAVERMFDRLAEDARLAAIMFNPIFLPHAQAIAHRATARAFMRYETELPRQSFDALLREEQLAARVQIMALPRKYRDTGARALESASDFMVQTAEETGNAVVQGAKIAKDVLVGGAAAVVGGIWAGLKACLRGVGAAFSGVGGALEAAGA